MPSQMQVLKMLAPHGFTLSPRQGFVGAGRTHPDGRAQRLDVFFWSGTRQADAAGIPRSYLVADLGLDAAGGPRRRLPLVHWPDDPGQRVPAAQQRIRPWREVVAEFEEVFIPAMNVDLHTGYAMLEALPERYLIS